MRKLILILQITILLISINLYSQELNDSMDISVHDSIDKLVKQTVKANDIPSISIGLIQNGKVSFQKGYGLIKRGINEKVNEHTSYQIASLSKMFTGIIAKALVLEGKLDIEQSIVNYFPNGISLSTKKKFGDVTMRDLLLHRSGLPRNSKSYKRKDGEPMISAYTESHLLQDLKMVKIKNKGDYNYSNLGYAILGYIFEKSTDLTYEELLNNYVIDKFNLKRTSTRSFLPQASPYRKDKRKKETQAWNTGKLTPASGIFSNTFELSNLMVEQLKVYRSNEKDKLKSPLYLTGEKELRNDQNSYYGMGLWEFEFKRGILYGHSGDMDGFASQYRFNITTNTGVVLLTSSGGEWLEELTAEISRIIEENEMKTGYNKG